MRKSNTKTRPRTPAQTATDELRATADTLRLHLAEHPDQVRGLLLGDLVAAVLGDDTPDALRRVLRPGVFPGTVSPETARTEGLAYIAASLWRRLLQLEQLSPDRAEAIAVRLAPLLESPALLFSFELDAQENGCDAARSIFAAALDKRFPVFRARLDTLPIDRELLEGAGFDLEKLDVRFHRSGHVASVRGRIARRDGPVLELAARPGTGRFRQTGNRGGYGFHVDETYGDGHASGVLCSPWHDGEEYRAAKPWLRWVLENIAEIRDRST